VLLAVVDPGVGGRRRAVAVEADGRFYIGPDNGLFELVCRRAKSVRGWDIVWRPESLSPSFHGRDLFAPVAARFALGGPDMTMLRATEITRFCEWPDDLPEIVYVDHYGNAMTGLRATALPVGVRLAVAGRVVERARTFSDVRPGSAMWYENANGLAEIAVNAGRADVAFGLTVGSPVAILA
jgi:hypothetical protein